MNAVVEEMTAILEGDPDALEHYGIKRRSGRYPWGSGEDPYQHSSDFLGRIEKLKKQGWTETPENIKKEFGLTTTQYRTQKALAKDERRMLKVETAKRLRDKEGMGATEIARKLTEKFGEQISESTVRSLLDAESESRMKKARETADFIKKQIDEKGMIDVGSNVNLELNISKEKLDQALAILEAEGYPVYGGRIPQATNPNQKTTIKVICPPGTEHKDIFNAFDNGDIHSLNEYITRDGGDTFEKKFHYPESMDSSRLKIRYNEEGGIEKDGIIELRRGVPDLSLGESRYAQVRILVDGDRYLKGMAVYSDDMPDGVDVIFNTNKKVGTPMRDVLKKIKDDPDNPFGSSIKDSEQGGQYWYDSKTGERIPGSSDNPNKKLGLINKRADEGDWTEWKDALPAQFLSKQPLQLAKKQLNLAVIDKKEEYDEICSLTNPTVKKYYLQQFADDCDSAAVHLQAAALPGQKYHVIVPVTTMKDTEIYAPRYDNGTQLALVRYPHGGTFEIPILTVNNKQKDAKKLLGADVSDAVGINSNVAARLSGADFDGDTVMCIPTNDPAGRVKIKSTKPLKGLEGFEPKSYQYDKTTTDSDGTVHYYRNGKEFRPMSKATKQKEMGVVSNLITDMTLKGAGTDELARAVRHSMVVIDAEKHHLDYKQSEIDNDIAGLKKEYQTYTDSNGKLHTGGASTLISRSKSEDRVLKRQGTPHINMKGKDDYDPTKPEGALLYKTADDAVYTSKKVNKKTGEVTTVTKYRTQSSTKMAEAQDARTLISDADTAMERLYADYANSMKSMANQARKEMMSTGKVKYSSAAKETYKNEVASLTSKLNTALLNSPRERQAQLKTYAEVKSKTDSDPSMSKEDAKKLRQRTISKYRSEVGSVKRSDRSIKITDKEWEAIQAGAVSENTLNKILKNTDPDSLRERATPRSSTKLSQAKINTIKAMRASNYTLGDIAKKLHVSPSVVSNYLKGSE